MKQAMRVLTSSESNEWYTPPQYADAARDVMGGIDLDPASNATANALIRATRIYTKDDNGFSREWHGRVFLNPPYGKTGIRSCQDVWARKLLAEYEAGRVSQAVLLTKTVPGYEWWDWMFHHWPGPLCITRGRIAFIKPEWMQANGHVEYPNGKDGRSKAASSFWYLGPWWDKFIEVFSEFGRCLTPDGAQIIPPRNCPFQLAPGSLS